MPDQKPDPIGGKRVTPHDRKQLQRMADGARIVATRIPSWPWEYKLGGDAVDEGDVLRWVRFGYIEGAEPTSDHYTLGISEAGRAALSSGWRVRPLQQEAFFPAAEKKRRNAVED